VDSVERATMTALEQLTLRVTGDESRWAARRPTASRSCAASPAGRFPDQKAPIVDRDYRTTAHTGLTPAVRTAQDRHWRAQHPTRAAPTSVTSPDRTGGQDTL